jgi:hypothetical protein
MTHSNTLKHVVSKTKKHVVSKTKICFCGHARNKHGVYADFGSNSKGCIYVCQADNCHHWNLCDLDLPKKKGGNSSQD